MIKNYYIMNNIIIYIIYNYLVLVFLKVLDLDFLLDLYHLWNLNTSEFYKEMVKSRYYDY